MSLIGNLEDLSLPDILQIISLSKKSGILVIHRGEEEGKIYIRQGKVILTTSALHRRNLGDIILEKKLVDRAQLETALEKQRQGGMRELLGMVLVRMKALPREALEKIIQEQIEETVFYFLAWKEGTFKFDLREVDNRLEVGVDPQVLISEKGIDTQWLVLEGTRLLDERRRKGPLRENGDARESAAGFETREGRALTLVDDDDYFSDQFTKGGARLGLTVNRLPGVAEAREFLSSFLGGEGLVMVVDVVMPTADGRGFLGGVELARTIIAEHPEVTLRVITAYPDDSVQEELRKIGVHPFLLKPDYAGGERVEEVVEGFIEDLLATVTPGPAPPRLPPAAETATAPSEEPVEEAIRAATLGLEELEPKIPEIPLAEEIEAAVKKLEVTLRQFPAQRQMVEDLVQEVMRALSPSEIGLLDLRLSSEFLERAILFKAGSAEVASLGGFGFEARVIKNRDGLRNLTVKLDNSSLLRKAVESRCAADNTTDTMEEDDLLAMVVGRPLPASWLIAPARGPASSAMILYGDNGSSGRPIQGGEILCHFFTLAGLCMDKLYQAKTAPGLAAAGRPTQGETS